MQGLVTSECLYEPLATLYHNSSIVLPRFIAKLKAVTLSHVIAQAYTEASTDSLQFQDSRAITASYVSFTV